MGDSIGNRFPGGPERTNAGETPALHVCTYQTDTGSKCIGLAGESVTLTPISSTGQAPTLSLMELRGVGIRTFHPHPRPSPGQALKEGGNCWLRFKPWIPAFAGMTIGEYMPLSALMERGYVGWHS